MMIARCSCPENLLIPFKKIKLSVLDASLFGQAYVRSLLSEGHDLSSELQGDGLLVRVYFDYNCRFNLRVRGVKTWDLIVDKLID